MKPWVASLGKLKPKIKPPSNQKKKDKKQIRIAREHVESPRPPERHEIASGMRGWLNVLKSKSPN